MKKASITVLSAALTVILSISCGNEKLPEGLSMSEWTAVYLEQTVREKKMRGGISAMIYKEGEILFCEGSGWADSATGWTVDGRTPMPVGSISKIFTSVALMKLVEEGRVDLDSPVGIYLPRLKLEEGREMDFTVRDLLTHHSGIPGDLFADWFDQPIDHLYELLNGRPLMAEPGTLFSYANTGFTLLGLIIEEVTGQSFEHYVGKTVFEPAGMAHSYVHSSDADAAGEELPIGYFEKSEIPVPNLRDYPAGGFIVPADDMGRFITALYRDHSILNRETLSLMLTVQNESNPVDRDFQIGLAFWLIDPFGTGELTASHGGDLPPYHALLITIPEKELAVYVATNDNGGGGTIAMETGVAIAKELISREGLYGHDMHPSETIALTGEEMAPYEGVYGTMAGLIELKPAKDYLKMKLGKIPLVLRKLKTGRYSAQLRPFNLFTLPVPQLSGLEIDLFEAEGKQWMGLWMQGVYMGAGSRLDPVSYSEEYQQLVGDYADPRGANILEDGSYAISGISIIERGGRYIMKVTLLGQNIEMALRPDGDGRAVTDGAGRGMGDLVLYRFDNEGQPVLSWSGFELKR
ncbi:MAG: beta-lactamase family protein [Spirochaetales bacterium]|nr:beta-lactamase family protein [Spirochaetales bacterium]